MDTLLRFEVARNAGRRPEGRRPRQDPTAPPAFPTAALLLFRLLDNLVVRLDYVLIGRAGLVGRSRVRGPRIEPLIRRASLLAHAGLGVDLLCGGLDSLLDVLRGRLDFALVVLFQGLPSPVQLGLDLLLGRVIDRFLPFFDVLLGLLDQRVETIPGLGLLTPILVLRGVRVGVLHHLVDLGVGQT